MRTPSLPVANPAASIYDENRSLFDLIIRKTLDAESAEAL